MRGLLLLSEIIKCFLRIFVKDMVEVFFTERNQKFSILLAVPLEIVFRLCINIKKNSPSFTVGKGSIIESRVVRNTWVGSLVPPKGCRLENAAIVTELLAIEEEKASLIDVSLYKYNLFLDISDGRLWDGLEMKPLKLDSGNLIAVISIRVIKLFRSLEVGR